MPTYEYECKKCKKRFEIFQFITEPALKKCRYCNGEAKRLIGTGSGIIFKGSGFYATDYKKGGRQEAKKDIPASCPLKDKDGGCSCCPGNG